MATDNKYDRQLRLWGSSGQKSLMEANILLVNASASGTETLKNLVLPGGAPHRHFLVELTTRKKIIGEALGSWHVPWHDNLLMNAEVDAVGMRGGQGSHLHVL